jgi:hypothetical protein
MQAQVIPALPILVLLGMIMIHHRLLPGALLRRRPAVKMTLLRSVVRGRPRVLGRRCHRQVRPEEKARERERGRRLALLSGRRRNWPLGRGRRNRLLPAGRRSQPRRKAEKPARRSAGGKNRPPNPVGSQGVCHSDSIVPECRMLTKLSPSPQRDPPLPKVL